MDTLQPLEAVRGQRTRIRQAALTTPVDWSAIDEGLHACYDDVARAFDIVAALDHLGMTDREFVARFFATTLHDPWTRFALADYVRWAQLPPQDGPHLWELAQFDGRMREYPRRHPVR